MDAAAVIQKHFPSRAPRAFVRTFGCQQNVADSEHLQGQLAALGFGFCDKPEDADLILLNTCAVREHAEDRVYGNLGALKVCKENNPRVIIAVCGCMVQQPSVAEKIKQSYPFVDMVFGPGARGRFPELLCRALEGEKRVRDFEEDCGFAEEGMPADGEPRRARVPVWRENTPVRRESAFKAFVPIMTGCDNFCTYCIVPHVRGREVSRPPQAVIDEVHGLIKAGYKDITLLGQNVNSYAGMPFSQLLRELDKIDGDYRLRFMTSHPKDATRELFDAVAGGAHIAPHVHLPVQAGSDRVLEAMNRRYTRDEYLALARYAAEWGIALTSDILIGFPGETEEDFIQTLDLIEQVRFVSLYMFLYSPRKGTPAAEMVDPVSKEEKGRRFDRVLRAQEEIAREHNAALVGQTRRALVENAHEARLADNRAVGMEAACAAETVGKFAVVQIVSAKNYALTGEIVS